MVPLKRHTDFSRPHSDELDQPPEVIDGGDAANDDSADGDAHLWAEYSRMSLEWQTANPAAGGAEAEAAMARFAQLLGI